MSAPIINPAAIQSLRSLGGDDDDSFLREIIAIFLTDTPVRIAELEAGLRDGNADTFMRAAHSIKGSSSNMGATVLQETAERLETESRTVGLTGMSARVAEVKAEFAKARAELEGYLPP